MERCAKCGSNIITSNIDDDLECANCGKVFYAPLFLGLIRPPFVDSLGRVYLNGRPGHPRTGVWRNCRICGKPLYIQRKRLKGEKAERGYYCRPCFDKYRVIEVGRRGALKRWNTTSTSDSVTTIGMLTPA